MRWSVPLRVLDGTVAVFCAKGGVEPQSETVWRQAEKYGVPRMAYVNKMDILGADFYRVVDMMKERLQANALPIQLPIGSEADFVGVVDLIRNCAYTYADDGEQTRVEIPAEMADQAEEYRNALLEAVAETSDELLDKYLSGGGAYGGGDHRRHPQSHHRQRDGSRGLRHQLPQQGRTVAAGCHRGLHAFPLDIPPMQGTKPGDEETEVIRHASDNEPFAALAFKIVSDPFVGKLAYVRVYSGTITSGSYVYNSTKGRRERVGRILQMHANHREEIDQLYAGDIAAIVGLKDTGTGDTLCAENQQVVLESMTFPEPVIRVAIEPKTKAGQDKMTIALVKLAEEDPTFKAYTDQETGQTIIAGMGELHLDIIVDRMLREFKVEANIGSPQVAYREAITKKVKAEGRYVRQSGGRGQFGHCVIELEPLEPGSGIEFVNAIVGGVVPPGVHPGGGGWHPGGGRERHPGRLRGCRL